jgi:hypothetical protein
MKRDTVGKISSELLQKQPETTDPIALEREMQEDYLKNLVECVEKHSKIFIKDFYVVVITKNEKLMPNVFRNYFAARESCPTPDYDQTVFKYNREAERLEYIWTIPSRDSCHHLKDNALEVHPSEKDLLKFVLQFADGSLYKLSKQLNGEEMASSLLIT